MTSRRTSSQVQVTNQFGLFAQIPVELVTDKSLSDRAVRVYALLWIETSKSDRATFRSRTTLADKLGVSKSTIDRGIGELVRRGAITVEERWDGDRQTTNLYTIVAPLPPAPKQPDKVIHRGRKYDEGSTGGGGSDLTTPGASNMTSHYQEPEDQELTGPVPEVTPERASHEPDRTGPGITAHTDPTSAPAARPAPPGPPPRLRSRTAGRPFDPGDVRAAVGDALPPTLDDVGLERLASEILGRAPTRVHDPTGYVIRTLRNPDGRLEWLGRALDLDLDEHERRTGTGGF